MHAALLRSGQSGLQPNELGGDLVGDGALPEVHDELTLLNEQVRELVARLVARVPHLPGHLSRLVSLGLHTRLCQGL